MIAFLRRVLQLYPKCPMCWRRDGPVFAERQNTAYKDDSMNFATGCRDCQDFMQDHWNAAWEEYWGGLL